MLSFLEVPIGAGGVARCSRCPGGTQRDPRPSRDVIADLRAAHVEMASRDALNVAFVGFEPFAHPELPALIGGAVQEGAQRIRLRTDGGALGVGGNAAGAFAAGVRQIELVLLAGTPSVHDSLTGAPGLFDAARNGIATFRACAESAGESVAITGLVPICAHTAAHAAAAVAVLAELGAVAVRLDVTSDAPAARAAALAALETATVNGMHGFVTGRVPGASPLQLTAPWRTVALNG